MTLPTVLLTLVSTDERPIPSVSTNTTGRYRSTIQLTVPPGSFDRLVNCIPCNGTDERSATSRDLLSGEPTFFNIPATVIPLSTGFWNNRYDTPTRVKQCAICGETHAQDRSNIIQTHFYDHMVLYIAKMHQCGHHTALIVVDTSKYPDIRAEIGQDGCPLLTSCDAGLLRAWGVMSMPTGQMASYYLEWERTNMTPEGQVNVTSNVRNNEVVITAGIPATMLPPDCRRTDIQGAVYSFIQSYLAHRRVEND